MRFLIVDDDPEYRRLLERGLSSDEASVTCAESADAARQTLADLPRGHFDLVVLDVSMPGTSGLALLAELRQQGARVPVVFVTARGAVAEKVEGLAAGADDWLVKPFALEELRARIAAVLRRQDNTLIEYGDVRVDLGRQRAFRGDGAVELSPREFELLTVLARAKGAVVSRQTLLAQIWNVDFDPGTNLIDVQMGRLRRKLDKLGPPCIESVRGQGFRLTAPAVGERDGTA
ncbi:MAG: DNA-binding response regulator [Planctomycetota bacterium]|nr:MAG: DNA-binding response regulator [Planctomycetota bacterium]